MKFKYKKIVIIKINEIGLIMKKLFLIRHAKSDWSNPFLNDFNRPLSKRGKSNAPLMGKMINSKNIFPDLFLSSPAKRAKKTAFKIASEILFDRKEIYFNKNIYDASSKTLLNIIKSIDNKYNIVFLVGHNPGLNMIAYNLIEFDNNIPTCGIIQIDFDVKNWEDISNTNSKLIIFEYPKKYIK